MAKLLSSEAPAPGWCLRPYVASLQKEYLEEVRQHDERGTLDRLFQFDDLPSCGYFVDESAGRKRRDAPDPPQDGAADPVELGGPARRTRQKPGPTQAAGRQTGPAKPSSQPSSAAPATSKGPASSSRPTRPGEVCLFEHPLIQMTCRRGDKCKWKHINSSPEEVALYSKAWYIQTKPRPHLEGEQLALVKGKKEN